MKVNVEAVMCMYTHVYLYRSQTCDCVVPATHLLYCIEAPDQRLICLHDLAIDCSRTDVRANHSSAFPRLLGIVCLVCGTTKFMVVKYLVFGKSTVGRWAPFGILSSDFIRQLWHALWNWCAAQLVLVKRSQLLLCPALGPLWMYSSPPL